MEPTEEERKKMLGMREVFTFAGLDEAHLVDDKTVAGSLAALLGAKPDTKPAALGILSEADYDAAVKGWKIPAAGGAARQPTLTELGQAKLIGHVCRIVAGNGETIEDLKRKASAMTSASPGPTSPSTSAAGRKIKLSSVISQIDDTEILLDEEKEILKAFARYEVVYGKGERPPKESEPTTEQITAVRHLLDQGSVPYVDFAIFGPYGMRIMKKVKLSGVMLGRDGSVKSQEFHGPANISHWIASYTVLQNVLVMLDAVDLGNLLRYKSLIERLHDKYGEKVWSVIYQGEVRCRLEHMPRLKRIAQAEYDQTKASGNPTPVGYEPLRPWSYVWAKAVEDLEFWREEVVETSYLILTRITNTAEAVEGDARTSPPGLHPRETTPAPWRMGAGATSSSPASPDPPSAGPEPRVRRGSRTGRFNNVADGRYLTNRTGHKLCADFNKGTCTEVTQGIWCQHAWDSVHQCERCLGSHSASKCPHAEMPEPGFLKRSSKGKGKKGGGKKGKGGRRPPY